VSTLASAAAVQPHDAPGHVLSKPEVRRSAAIGSRSPARCDLHPGRADLRVTGAAGRTPNGSGVIGARGNSDLLDRPVHIASRARLALIADGLIARNAVYSSGGAPRVAAIALKRSE